MAIEDELSRGGPRPGAAGTIRELLFGDVPVDRWPPEDSPATGSPWDLFRAARGYLGTERSASAIVRWRKITEDPEAASRHRLQAYHFLREHGRRQLSDDPTETLGVVVDVWAGAGIDTLAAYGDHTARYCNHSGSAIIWDARDRPIDESIHRLLAASRKVVAEIGPWKGERPGPPPPGQDRVSFLTSRGLHFGQGPQALIWKDPLSGPVFAAAAELMQRLIAKTGST